MKRLPSFTALFLLFVIGFVMWLLGSFGFISAIGNYTLASVFHLASMAGMLLMVVAPLLILLKFFVRLDREDQR